MKLNAYASLAAFLAHRRALKQAGAGGLSADELARSAEMEKIIASLRPEERATLEGASADGGARADGTTRRHRERAEASLARELRARGLLAP
ncbi:MAG TPA: hypothetical protein VMI09_10305 [Candidatus Binataceae bacterium]|nr:hypothetical protein [Candidatus Binataceae bacterium]